MDEIEIDGGAAGSNRRQFLKRTAVVGGGLIWAAPVVQSVMTPAHAVGSVQQHACDFTPLVLLWPVNGTFVPLGCIEVQSDNAPCCAVLAVAWRNAPLGAGFLAVLLNTLVTSPCRGLLTITPAVCPHAAPAPGVRTAATDTDTVPLIDDQLDDAARALLRSLVPDSVPDGDVVHVSVDGTAAAVTLGG